MEVSEERGLMDIPIEMLTSGIEWSSLPIPILSSILRKVLERSHTLAEIVCAWQDLALVSKHWLAAARACPICLTLSEPPHMSDSARAWLARGVMEVLMLKRRMINQLPGIDFKLLESPDFIENSKGTLQGLSNINMRSIPLLSPFIHLKQLTIYHPEAEIPDTLGDTGDALPDDFPEICRALPKLQCLTIAGYFFDYHLHLVPIIRKLPGTLKHLGISLHNRHGVLVAALPREAKRIEYVSFKADCVVVDWHEVLTKVEELCIGAEVLMPALRTGDEGLRMARSGDRRDMVQQLANTLMLPATPKPPKKDNNSCSDIITSSDGTDVEQSQTIALEQTTLAFQRLAFCWQHQEELNAPPSSAAIADMEEFLDVIRERVHGAWDVNPAVDMVPSFTRDKMSEEQCFVLQLDRQDDDAPRSYHFTTPVTDTEAAMLKAHPCWKISWCADERAPEILHDPEFIKKSSPVLRRLSRLSLHPQLDLRPFTELRTLNGTLQADNITELKLPTSITSLGLDVPQDLGYMEFDSSTLSHLSNLKDLALTRFGHMDLTKLPPHLISLRIVEPIIKDSEDVYAENAWTFPEGRVLQQVQQEGVQQLEVKLEAGSAENSVGWDNVDVDVDMSQAASEVETHAVTAAAEPTSSDAAVKDQGDKVKQRRRRRKHRHRYQEDSLEGPGGIAYGSDAEDEIDEASSQDNKSSHSSQCDDPLCPLHSGKKHLQTAFSNDKDVRVDLLSLLRSGFPMITISYCEGMHSEDMGTFTIVGEVSWPMFVDVLVKSNFEVLEINVFDPEVPCYFETAPRFRWLPHQVPHRQSLLAGLRALEQSHGDVFTFKTWDGIDAMEGLREGGRGYALMRKSVMEKKDRKEMNDDENAKEDDATALIA